jgi:hypothetical protein
MKILETVLSASLTGALVLCTCLNLFVVVPAIEKSSAAIQGARKEALEDARTFENARKRQIVQEASLLRAQDQNLKLAKEIQTRLMAARGD